MLHGVLTGDVNGAVGHVNSDAILRSVRRMPIRPSLIELMQGSLQPGCGISSGIDMTLNLVPEMPWKGQ
jgi:hypothetical protein